MYQPIDEATKKDKALIIMLLIMIPSIIYFGLSSAMYFLGYNVLVLSIIAIFGLLFGRKYIYEKHVEYGTLILIPFFIRLVATDLMASMFTFDFQTIIQELYRNFNYGMQLVGLIAVIAVAEEGFRASIIALLQELFSRRTDEASIQILIITVANILWILFHFVQRNFVFNMTMIYYVVWLLITGYILSIVLIKAGLGTAALAHFLINISA